MDQCTGHGITLMHCIIVRVPGIMFGISRFISSYPVDLVDLVDFVDIQLFRFSFLIVNALLSFASLESLALSSASISSLGLFKLSGLPPTPLSSLVTVSC